MENTHENQKLTAHVVGVFDQTSNVPSAQTRHLVSGASSVVSSSHSLSSSSTCRAPSHAGGCAGSNSSHTGAGSIHATVPAAPLEGSKESPPQQLFPLAASGSVAPASHDAATPTPTPASRLAHPMVLHMNAPPHPVAEFLFQLTKMLTDNNSKYIEWHHASIFVHDPPGLAKNILPKYFRHSNYASFQRQMNYFNFRKIAGKGKMAPCSYVNAAANEDISSLLFIKRKPAGVRVRSNTAKLMAQQNRAKRSIGGTQNGAGDLMGNTLGTLSAALPANSDISPNNFPMMPGETGKSMMAQVLAGNIVSSTACSLAQANTFSQQQQKQQQQQQQQQQNILAQLQQAHSSALATNHLQGANLGCIHPGAQNKAPNPGFSMNNYGGNNIPPLMTTTQGSVFTNSGNPTDRNSSADAMATQSLFIQQASQGRGGNFSQGIGRGNVAVGSNNLVRLDSGADLRALINHQISMFNNPVGDLAMTMDSFGAPLGAPMPSSGMAQSQVSSTPQGAGLTGNPSQGVSFDWNEMLKHLGCVGNVDNSTVQQLLQGSTNAASGPPAATGQSFNLINGLFSPGGGTLNDTSSSFS